MTSEVPIGITIKSTVFSITLPTDDKINCLAYPIQHFNKLIWKQRNYISFHVPFLSKTVACFSVNPPPCTVHI